MFSRILGVVQSKAAPKTGSGDDALELYLSGNATLQCAARRGKHGLQRAGTKFFAWNFASGLHGGTIHLPNRVKDLPDRDRLALRFEPFMAAT
jgi:hypothetical protein